MMLSGRSSDAELIAYVLDSDHGPMPSSRFAIEIAAVAWWICGMPLVIAGISIAAGEFNIGGLRRAP